MKKTWMLILLVSLGFNLGFGLRMLNDRPDRRERGHFRRGEQTHRFGGRWTDRDSVAHGKMISRRMDRITDFLNLSPEQREVFRSVHAETGRMLMNRRIQITEKRDLLHDLVTSEEVDKEEIHRAIAELGRQQAVLDSLVAETVLQEMAVLDPGQREKYLEMLFLDRERHGLLRGGGGPRHRRQ